MLKIGLTGGMGCGKTVVANLFKRYGIEIIDADEVARLLVEPGKAGLKGIVDRFGTNVLDARGHLNRAALGAIVFDSPEQRKKLEAILHPLIYRHIETEMAGFRGPYCLACVPLLLETGRRALFHRVLVVDSPVELQYARVRTRNNLDDRRIARILECQVSREERLCAADEVISNDRDAGWLDKQIEKFHNFYLDLSKSSGWSN